MKKQYKVFLTGKQFPYDSIRTVHAESEKEAKEVAAEKYPNTDAYRVELIR